MNRRWRRILILLGLLVAFALRVHRLGAQNVWWDEGLSVLAARKSFLGTTLWTAADVHPPLYFWLLWPWSRLAGESEFALRFITVMESMLMVALMVPLGRRLSKQPAVGVAALWLLGLSRFHIWWSQEMRMYVLAGFFSMLSLYFVGRLTSSKRSFGSWAGWGVATLGALYTIYSSIVLVLIENLFMLVVGVNRERRARLWRDWFLAQIAVGLGMIPWLALALPRMRSWSVLQEPASLRFVLELNAVLLTLGISTDVGRYVVPAILVIGAAVGGIALNLPRASRIARQKLRPGESLVLLGLGILLPPLTIWILTQPRAIFYTPRVEARYLLPFAPAFYLVIAWGLIGWLRSARLRPVGILTGLGVISLFVGVLPGYYAPRYLRDDYPTLVRTIWTYARPDDVVVLVSGDRYPLFHTYYDRDPAPENRPPTYWMPGEPEAFTSEFVDDLMPDVVADHGRVWLVQVERGLQDPEGFTEAWLDERYARILSFDVGYNNLSLFAPEGAGPPAPVGNLPPQHQLSESLTPGVELLGYDLLTDEFRPLDTLRLGLYLKVEREATLSVALVHEDGREIAREVEPLTPVAETLRRQVEFLVTPYTPRGRYHFEVYVEGGESRSLGTLRITHTERAVDPSRIPHPMQGYLGEEIQLLGYRISGAKGREIPVTHPDDTLSLELYWQASAPVQKSYHVFTHLLGSQHNPVTGGPVWAQDDQVPLEGAYPTDRWLPGIPLVDTYELVIPPETPPGEYSLTVGMYNPANGERLPVSGDGAVPDSGYLLLTMLRVEP
ncbi:MAG: glycosyltransferase family 39 protein [Anaerolineae bacterium]